MGNKCDIDHKKLKKEPKSKLKRKQIKKNLTLKSNIFEKYKTLI